MDENRRRTWLVCIVWAVAASLLGIVDLSAQQIRSGSRAAPLRVMLIPADGGTQDGTRADYEPVFRAVSQMTGLHFELRVGLSWAIYSILTSRSWDSRQLWRG